MQLTAETKRERRIERAYQAMRCLSIGSVFNKHPSGLACLFQKLVRLRSADENGNCRCITCGVVQPWNVMDSGHYVSRNNKATIMDARNCWPQCKADNQHKGGSTAAYRLALVAKFGEASVQELEATKLPKTHVWDRRRLAELKIDMLDEIKVLQGLLK